MSDELKRKQVEGRRRRNAAINLRTLVRDDRKLGQIPTPMVAIQNFCRSCFGFEADGGTLAETIKGCESTSCWLWPWRTGKLTADRPQSDLDE